MSQTNSLKLGWIVVLLLFMLNATLVFLIPEKPPSIEKIVFPISAIDPQLRITFSETMNKVSVQDNFSIEPQIEGDFSWSGRTLVYTPKNNLNFDQTYNLEITGDTLSERGNSLQNPWREIFKTPPLSFFFINTSKDHYGQLTEYSVADHQTREITPKGQTIRYFDYDGTTKKIVALTAENNDILLIDPTNLETSTLELDGKDSYVHRVKWLPFESEILISRSDINDEVNSELLLYDLGKKSFTVVQEGPTLVYDFFPTPDGRGILFIDESGALVIKSLSDMSLELVAKEFLQHFGFSEYGGYLLYTVLTPQGIFDSANSLIIQNSFGEKEVILQNANITIDQASVSPDETKVVFLHKTQIYDLILADQPFRLARMLLDSKDISLLTPEDFSVNQPEYSPDGEMISLVNSDVSGWDLMNEKLQGGEIFLYSDELDSIGIQGTDIEWVY